MTSHYNQNYSLQQIENILKTIKECVKSGNYILSLNEKRNENRRFLNEYRISSSKTASIISEIKISDFCHTLINTKSGYEHEVLYVFVPKVKLKDSAGFVSDIDVYTKFNIITNRDDAFTIVISFHKKNKPITYAFK